MRVGDDRCSKNASDRSFPKCVDREITDVHIVQKHQPKNCDYRRRYACFHDSSSKIGYWRHFRHADREWRLLKARTAALRWRVIGSKYQIPKPMAQRIRTNPKP